MELIYEQSTAPLVPPCTAADMANPPLAEEMLPVVEPSGLVTGRCRRSYAHGGAKPLHPVVHLHILNRSGDLYLQKRSMSKQLLPGRWGTAVGGHVAYGESLSEALYREAEEELGLYDFNPIRIDDYVFESEMERELVNIWAIVGNFTPHVSEEVSDGRWWTRSDISKTLGKDVFTPQFESEYARIGDALYALL